jgi:hypothetical protein
MMLSSKENLILLLYRLSTKLSIGFVRRLYYINQLNSQEFLVVALQHLVLVAKEFFYPGT